MSSKNVKVLNNLSKFIFELHKVRDSGIATDNCFVIMFIGNFVYLVFAYIVFLCFVCWCFSLHFFTVSFC